MSNLTGIEKKIVDNIIDEWVLKGHNLTGSFVKSLAADINEDDDGFTMNIKGKSYGFIKNSGVNASNIPYSGRSGNGGKSKYITGLKNYVKLRMGITDEREALGIAFAIAKKQSKNGVPGSGFLDDAIKKAEDELGDLIVEYIDNKLQLKKL
jgi:GTP-binding protein EngB required for normal cell division